MRIGQWPLAVKLWGLFAALTLLVFMLVSLLLPWMLKSFFTEQLYDILVDSQANVKLLGKASPLSVMAVESKPVIQPDVPSEIAVKPAAKTAFPLEAGPASVSGESETNSADAEKEPVTRMVVQFMPQNGDAESAIIEQKIPRPLAAGKGILVSKAQPAVPVVQHFVINGDNEPGLPAKGMTNEPPEAFMEAIEKNAQEQAAPLEKYSLSVNDQNLLYVIKKEMLDGKPNYLVSYAWGNYRNDLVMSMFARLLVLMVGVIAVSLLPCIALARYLTRPLVQMERHVGRLAERDWHEPLETRRKDEIGRLAQAIETMRQRLLRQDKAQQFFLQNISHELKTPVMVIRSYAQSIQDGIFPKGTLQESLNIMMKEAARLEKRIRDLLLLNKWNYLSSRVKNFEPFPVKPIVEDVIERLRYRRPEIEWELSMDDSIQLSGDREQWIVAFENMLDNQLRYAQSRICISASLTSESGAEHFAASPVIRIANDGPSLDEETAESLFEPFKTGKDGQFGLGLAIVRQIAEHHRMSVSAVNEEGEVVYYLRGTP
ncbi:sensor histidine kinase [Paenibacillus hamazuiensis]|uniref:sensor histidine kinase n=1 Tax=Paenibacillus hamazuiensis TaxID=2936508 RepID=UPI00200FB8E7|nr:HAMP domain-containing sensor histidine kinase [Paenibacillus hamazuiensis]